MRGQERNMESNDIKTELNDLKEQLNADYKRNFIGWCIRWLIGFTLIALICQYNPQLRWLWTMGLVVSIASLSYMFFTTFMVHKKIEKVILDNEL